MELSGIGIDKTELTPRLSNTILNGFKLRNFQFVFTILSLNHNDQP